MKPSLDLVQSLIGLRFFFSLGSWQRVGLSWERLPHLQLVQYSAFGFSKVPGTFKDRTRWATAREGTAEAWDSRIRPPGHPESRRDRRKRLQRNHSVKKKIQENKQTRWKREISPTSWEQERLYWEFYNYITNTPFLFLVCVSTCVQMHVSMCGGGGMCMYIHVCICLWRPEDHFRCHPEEHAPLLRLGLS